MSLFNSSVMIEGDRGDSPRVSLTVPCCPMDGSLDEPMGDGSVQSVRRNMTFVVKRNDLGGIEPQVGDIVTVESGARFAVKKIQPFYNRELIMDCRSC